MEKLVSNMSPEDVAYNEALLDMFDTDGWRELIKEVENTQARNEKEVFDYDEKTFLIYKGSRQAFNWLLTLEQTVKGALDDSL